MLGGIADALREHPELALFLTLALGYGAGRLPLGRFQPGPVVGVLLAGIAVGQLQIPVSGDLKAAFFLLFLFSVGYKAGPQFFHGLRSSGAAQAGLAVLFCSVGLAVAWLLARAFGFDAGTAAGLVAGALTEPAALGSGSDALAALPLGEAARETLQEKLSVAFAVTFVVGLVTAVGMISVVGPRLLGGDLAEACRRLEEELGAATHEPGVVSAYRTFELRAYAVPETLAGRTAAELEALFAPERVFVERVGRGGAALDAEPETRLRAGDRVALSGRREVLVGDANPLRQGELEDRPLLDVPTIALDTVLTRRDLDGRSLAEVAELAARDVATRGVFVRRIARAGQELPSGPGTVLERGDVLTLVGARRHVERVAARVGFVERPSAATDVATVGGAIALGGLLGLPALRLGGVEIGLSLPVGVLLGGLLTGWLRSLHPVFGRVPEPALWVFDSFGLTAFLALVGLEAGPGFARGLQESGLALVGAAAVVCAVPHAVTMLVGRYLLGLHPGVLLGICAGAGTSMPGLAALQEVARSRVPTLGFGVSYAVGNVLLVLAGTAIVALTAG